MCPDCRAWKKKCVLRFLFSAISIEKQPNPLAVQLMSMKANKLRKIQNEVGELRMKHTLM